MQGGTEHVTLAVARSLQLNGCKCYLAYGMDCQLEPSKIFDGKLKYSLDCPGEELRTFISSHGIRVIISNLVTINYKRGLLSPVCGIARDSGCKLIACYHAMPGEELLGNSPACCIHHILHGESLRANLKDLTLGLVPRRLVESLNRRYISSRYRVMYDNCDCLVLLSPQFYGEFARLGGLQVDGKFTSIPNALTYDEFLPEEEIASKGREVLLLARMDEKSKRISEALRIWEMIEKDGAHEDWQLTIVGGGRDLDWLRRRAARMGLQRVCFEGRQPDALSYYRRAAIFMMTSRYEGWGLTLTESQQMGVVPLAYHSYASLTEIISDGEDGFIIPEGNRKEYYSKLVRLMDDAPLRQKMAAEAIRSSHRFEPSAIAGLWLRLIGKCDN